MNSTILVSGFVVVGVGTMACLFGPSFSSPDTSNETAVSYQQKSNVGGTATATSPAIATVADETPFVWEDAAAPELGVEMIEEIASSSAVPESTPATKITADRDRDSGLASFAQQHSNRAMSSTTAFAQEETVAADVPPTSPTSSSSFFNDSVETPAPKSGLSDFFGTSSNQPPVAQPAPKQTIAAKPPKKTIAPAIKKETPVRVAKLVQPKAKPAKPTKPAITATTQPLDDSLEFMLLEDSTPVPSLSAPKAAPKVAPKTVPRTAPTLQNQPKSNEQESKGNEAISGSLEPVNQPVSARVKITNPASNGLTVSFLVNSEQITLKPQQSYVVSDASKVNVKFSRGGDYGVAVQSLSTGDYSFSVSREEGWKLAQ